MQPSTDHHASDQPSSMHGTTLSAQHGPADGTANVARVYGALLGEYFL